MISKKRSFDRLLILFCWGLLLFSIPAGARMPADRDLTPNGYNQTVMGGFYITPEYINLAAMYESGASEKMNWGLQAVLGDVSQIGLSLRNNFMSMDTGRVNLETRLFYINGSSGGLFLWPEIIYRTDGKYYGGGLIISNNSVKLPLRFGITTSKKDADDTSVEFLLSGNALRILYSVRHDLGNGKTRVLHAGIDPNNSSGGTQIRIGMTQEEIRKNPVKKSKKSKKPATAPEKKHVRPAAEKSAKTHHVVKPGQCLWWIAEDPSVYGDPWKWPRLYYSNKNKIMDPDLIYPNQDLVIPRDNNYSDQYPEGYVPRR